MNSDALEDILVKYILLNNCELVSGLLIYEEYNRIRINNIIFLKKLIN